LATGDYFFSVVVVVVFSDAAGGFTTVVEVSVFFSAGGLTMVVLSPSLEGGTFTSASQAARSPDTASSRIWYFMGSNRVVFESVERPAGTERISYMDQSNVGGAMVVTVS